jgi:hypothetical protein
VSTTHTLPNPISKMAILKIVILADTETKSKSEPLRVPFYGNPLNSACGCIKMSITIAVVTKNVSMSRHSIAEQVAYGVCNQPSSRFMLHMP